LNYFPSGLTHFSIVAAELESTLDLKNNLEPQVKSVRTRLECRSGLYLAVNDAGVVQVGPSGMSAITVLMTVQGLKEKDSQFVTWLLIPVGLRVVALQNEATSLYIGMNSEGRIYTSVILSLIKIICL